MSEKEKSGASTSLKIKRVWGTGSIPSIPDFFQRKNLMLLGFNDSKCTAYPVDSARGLIVI